MDARALKELGLLEVSRWYERVLAPAETVARSPGAESSPAQSAAAGADWETLRTLVAKCSKSSES